MKKSSLIFFSIFIAIFFQSTVNFSLNNPVKGELFTDSVKSLESILAPVVNQTFQDLIVPGAIVGVYVGDYEPWTTTLGVANLQTKEPIKIDDKMRIGSITKTFTGTVLLQLVDEGKISLDDKLSKYFPDYPNGENITIFEVGNMTSGLYNYSEDSTFGEGFMQNMAKSYTPEELIAIAKKHPPYFAPGTSIHYSNTNYILLGSIIEKLTGNSIQAEIQNRILNPLGMTETTFALDSNFPDPHAHGYYYMDSTSAEPTDVTNLNPSWGWAAGSMISTLADLQKYAKPLATGQLISRKTQEERIKWYPFGKPATGSWAGITLGYGFGLADFGGAYGHNGGIPGFNSFMAYIPEKDATVIVLVNMQDNKNGIGPADYIARKIIEKIKGIK